MSPEIFTLRVSYFTDMKSQLLSDCAALVLLVRTDPSRLECVSLVFDQETHPDNDIQEHCKVC